MGGGRNGRYMKWLVAVLAFLGTVYLFYQYRGLNSALREKEEELERLEDLQSRLGDQLKDLAGSHTSMQDELKTERVDHHRTRMEKSALDKQCQADLKSLKETADSETFKLEQERDSCKMEMEEMKDSKQRIQAQQDSLLSRYDQDIAACEQEKNRNSEKLGSYMTDIAKANTAKQRAEAELTQCNTQLGALEDNLQMKDFRLSSLQDDLLRCQGNLQTVTSQKEQIEEEMEEMKKRQGPPGKMAGNMDHLSDKDAMFKAMSEKLSRGEKLNEHEQNILELLKNGPEQGDQKFDPWGARKVRQNPYVSDGGRGGQSQQFPHGQPPAAKNFRPPVEDRRFPGYNPVGGGGRGMEPNLGRVPGGMGTRRSPSEKQQLPELAEQEEVKELQIEDQEPHGGLAGVDVAGREEKKGGGEDGDQGMDEQAFDPEEKKPGEEEEERDYNFDQVQEKPVENLNLPVPGGGQDGAMPDPHRVVVDGDFEGGAKIHSPPKFENPDRAFDDQDQLSEQEELEKEQEGEEEEGVNKDEGHKQFEEDVRMDREERLRVRAVPRGRGMEQGQRGWNGDRGGMEHGQQEVDDVMKQEMNVNDLRRKEVANQLEIEELQRRWALIGILQLL
jgi:hypothetical protein